MMYGWLADDTTTTIAPSTDPTSPVAIVPTGTTMPIPAPIPTAALPAGHCGGLTPGWYCPQYADRNAVFGAAMGILIGAGLKGSRATSMMAGAAFFGLASWYFFSGRWWR